MKRLAAFAVVAMVSAGTALAFQEGTPSQTQPPSQANAEPAPTTGRTLEDVRKAYSPPPRAMAARLEEPAPAPPPVHIVQANVFAVTDQRGNVRAEIGARDDEAKIQMFDLRGKPRLVLTEKGGLATVTLITDSDQEGLVLRLTPDGAAQITVGAAKAGTTKANTAAPLTLRGGTGDVPAITLRDEAGGETAKLSAHRPEGAFLELHSSKADSRLQPGTLHLSTPDGGPQVSLGIANGNFVSLSMSRGKFFTEPKLELGCAGEVAWLDLNTTKFGRASLRAADDGSMFTLKPIGGEGGLFAVSRLENSTPQTRLYLSDTDGTQKVQVQVLSGKPSITLWDGRQGQPALFSTP